MSFISCGNFLYLLKTVNLSSTVSIARLISTARIPSSAVFFSIFPYWDKSLSAIREKLKISTLFIFSLPRSSNIPLSVSKENCSGTMIIALSLKFSAISFAIDLISRVFPLPVRPVIMLSIVFCPF